MQFNWLQAWRSFFAVSFLDSLVILELIFVFFFFHRKNPSVEEETNCVPDNSTVRMFLLIFSDLSIYMFSCRLMESTWCVCLQEMFMLMGSSYLMFFFLQKRNSHTLLFESKKKTDRTPLDQEKVYKLLGKVEKKHFCLLIQLIWCWSLITSLLRM